MHDVHNNQDIDRRIFNLVSLEKNTHHA
jgi:hypothetical protein